MNGNGDESGNGSGNGNFWVYWGNGLWVTKKLKMGNDVQRKAKCVL